MNELKLIPRKQIVKAAWNYKEPGTKKQIQKLAKSIERDNSAGVLPVRKITVKGKTVYETMDGNHRIDGIDLLKWKNVPCEIFENITDAEAALIAERRNGDWFDTDQEKLAALMRDVVIPEIAIEEILGIMPYTSEYLDELLALDTQKSEVTDEGPGSTLEENHQVYSEKIRPLHLFFTQEDYKDVMQKVKRVMIEESLDDASEVFKHLLDKK